VKVREIIRLIEADGGSHHSTRGLHRRFTHASKPGQVTVAGKRREDLHPKMQASILRPVGLRT